MDSIVQTKTAKSEEFITVKGLCKSFSGQPVYKNFDLNLANHQLVSIFGPNGCGKSTLINMMSGLIPLDQGEIKIHGKPIHRTRIGYVFQNYRDSLFPWMSAYDNIAYPLRVKGISERECRHSVEHLIETFNICLDLKRYPYSFSGGQQQLVSILRALVAQPEVLFLDEPFSALDFETTLFVRDKLQEIFMATNIPMLMVVHNLEEAIFLADKILLLSKRPTQVVEMVSFDAPRPRTPETLTSRNFVEVSRYCLDIFRQEMQK
ncbi:ABC transporter ATP-binding protein [Cylindrospermopsis raciborskii LB2897]|jgi:NitT/TauT family transport system ATP-binding protein|uniref:ABC transporter ATP-binding protein n=1 Tax=Cylindrospermopsis raciborskii TaxID=77022 RepID=UPI001454BE95|nr:ABC transporter ATP-binding protein [Cylindrospermopsis raciborskii LB2897]